MIRLPYICAPLMFRGLDVTTQAQILELIRKIQKRKGMSVMFITHDFGVVSEIADSVIVIEKGNLVEQGTAAEVLKNPKHPYTQRLIAAVPHMRENDKVADDRDDIVLEVSKLEKTYHVGSGMFGRKRVVPALKGVSFTLKRRQTLGVVGESGSGKSVTAVSAPHFLALFDLRRAFHGWMKEFPHGAYGGVSHP